MATVRMPSACARTAGNGRTHIEPRTHLPVPVCLVPASIEQFGGSIVVQFDGRKTLGCARDFYACS